MSATNAELVSATPPKGLWKGFRYSIRSIWGARELLGLLLKRDLKSRYKDSALGIVWSLFKPIIQLLIYFIAIGQFLGAARSIPDFAVFIFAGLTAWGLFSEVLSGATGSIVQNSGLIKKVYLPSEIFPLSATGSALFYFCVQFVILFLATLVVSKPPLIENIGYTIAGVLLLAIFSFALGLLFSALNVYFRDMQHLVEVLLLILFWASPVVYSYGFVNTFMGGSFWAELYLSNPITIGILSFQKGMWSSGAGQEWPVGLEQRLFVGIVVSLLLVIFSQRIFAKLSGNFAQEL